jgi:hypothetical protein
MRLDGSEVGASRRVVGSVILLSGHERVAGTAVKASLPTLDGRDAAVARTKYRDVLWTFTGHLPGAPARFLAPFLRRREEPARLTQCKKPLAGVLVTRRTPRDERGSSRLLSDSC